MANQFLVLSGTNRLNSNTIGVAKLYHQLLAEKGLATDLYSLEGWNWFESNPDFDQIQQRLLIPASHFVIVSPEYNGSIPGVLKLMIDISNHKTVWQGKKALLVGVSTGRAGNLRGMEHLTGILHHLKTDVHYNKLPISMVDKLRNNEGEFSDAGTLRAINNQLNEFIKY